MSTAAGGLAEIHRQDDGRKLSTASCQDRLGCRAARRGGTTPFAHFPKPLRERGAGRDRRGSPSRTTRGYEVAAGTMRAQLLDLPYV